MQNTLITTDSARTGKFLGQGFLLMAAFYLVIIKLLPDAFLQTVIDLTGNLAAAVALLLGVTSSYESGLVTVAGYQMQISFECTALHFLGIFFAGVLAWPLHELRYKLKGIWIGGLVILSMNVLRIVVLGVVGARFPQHFDLVHAYLWQGAFAVVVFLMWLAWVDKAFLSRPHLRFLITALISAFAAVLAINLILGPYLMILAFVGEKTLNGISSLIGSSGFIVDALADKIGFQHSGNVTYFPVSVDIYDTAIFIALLIASSRSLHNAGRLTKGLLPGFGILCVMHTLFVIVVGNLILFKINADTVSDVLWMMRFASILTPVALWWYFRRVVNVDVSMQHEEETATDTLIQRASQGNVLTGLAR